MDNVELFEKYMNNIASMLIAVIQKNNQESITTHIEITTENGKNYNMEIYLEEVKE